MQFSLELVWSICLFQDISLEIVMPKYWADGTSLRIWSWSVYWNITFDFFRDMRRTLHFAFIYKDFCPPLRLNWQMQHLNTLFLFSLPKVP